MRKRNFWNVLWGMMFIAGACLIVLHLLGMLGEFNTWTLLIGIPIAIGAISCALKKMWSGMFFLLGTLAFIYRDYIAENFGIEYSFWVLLGIVVLLSIGFHMLFGGPNNWKRTGHMHWTYDSKGSRKEYYPSIEDATGEKLYFSESFTGACKYIKSDNLSYVRIDNSFGGIEIYFDKATLAPEGAVVDIDNKFGGVEMYIPGSWNVINDISSFAGVSECPRVPLTEGAPTITIRGSNKFGGVEINLV